MNKIKGTLKGCSNPCTTHPIQEKVSHLSKYQSLQKDPLLNRSKTRILGAPEKEQN